MMYNWMFIYYNFGDRKLNANEDDSVSDLQMSSMVVISIVFPSWIIHEFDKILLHGSTCSERHVRLYVEWAY